MSLNISKGNMYEFITHTWNTVKGECYHDCSYCYMKRWGKQNPVKFDDKELKTDLGSGNFIFVGSSCDMFAEDIKSEWIKSTIDCCKNFDNRYFLQTKNTERLFDLAFLLNDLHDKQFSICTTFETNRDYPEIMNKSPKPTDRIKWFHSSGFADLDKYITIEPILDFDLDEMLKAIKAANPKQVNIGADSGNNGLPEPSSEKVLQLIEGLKEFTTLSPKTNLKRILNN
jgi:DNA repair photolyase